MTLSASSASLRRSRPSAVDVARREPVMPPDLRGAMRNCATGVCVATTYGDRAYGRRHGALTVNSLTSLPLDPPLVSLCLRLDSSFLRDLLETKRWAMCILDAHSGDM